MFLSLDGFGVLFYLVLRAKMQSSLSELSRAGEKLKNPSTKHFTKIHESMTVFPSQSHPSTNFFIT
jgi:hypothetical protein